MRKDRYLTWDLAYGGSHLMEIKADTIRWDQFVFSTPSGGQAMKNRTCTGILVGIGFFAAGILSLTSAATTAQESGRPLTSGQAPKDAGRASGQRTFGSKRERETPRSREMTVRRAPPTAKKVPFAQEKRRSITKSRPPKAVQHADRRWRSGRRWRWIVVPSIIVAGELDWCHYHRYRVAGMHFHRDIRCHQHAQWDHPAIRYVEAY